MFLCKEDTIPVKKKKKNPRSKRMPMLVVGGWWWGGMTNKVLAEMGWNHG